MPADQTHPDAVRPELERHLAVIERAIADPSARQDRPLHIVMPQASWLLTALGRPDPALAAAQIAQASWGVMRDASRSQYGGGLSWEAYRAAAVALMSVEDWPTAQAYLHAVLCDFAEEDQSFHLFELCLHAQGRRPWNTTQTFIYLTDPDGELAAFDARAYALEQYREDRFGVDPGRDPNSGQDPTEADPAPRWRGVPVPPDLLGDDHTAARAHADPVIRACALAATGAEDDARDTDRVAEHDRDDESQAARRYVRDMSIPRAMGLSSDR